jgi:hypothetical protein
MSIYGAQQKLPSPLYMLAETVRCISLRQEEVLSVCQAASHLRVSSVDPTLPLSLTTDKDSTNPPTRGQDRTIYIKLKFFKPH